MLLLKLKWVVPAVCSDNFDPNTLHNLVSEEMFCCSWLRFFFFMLWATGLSARPFHRHASRFGRARVWFHWSCCACSCLRVRTNKSLLHCVIFGRRIFFYSCLYLAKILKMTRIWFIWSHQSEWTHDMDTLNILTWPNNTHENRFDT